MVSLQWNRHNDTRSGSLSTRLQCTKVATELTIAEAPITGLEPDFFDLISEVRARCDS